MTYAQTNVITGSQGSAEYGITFFDTPNIIKGKKLIVDNTQAAVQVAYGISDALYSTNTNICPSFLAVSGFGSLYFIQQNDGSIKLKKTTYNAGEFTEPSSTKANLVMVATYVPNSSATQQYARGTWEFYLGRITSQEDVGGRTRYTVVKDSHNYYRSGTTGNNLYGINFYANTSSSSSGVSATNGPIKLDKIGVTSDASKDGDTVYFYKDLANDRVM